MEELRAREPGTRRGTCELCGAHDRELKVMAMMDFIGWTCQECRDQLRLCALRLFCGTVEWTEEAE